jgi:hypothetical protein
MMNSQIVVEALSSPDLLAATQKLVHRSRGVEAELLLHLGEIDARKLFLAQAFNSMFAFCVGEYGFSEDAAYSRITLARAGRRLPAILEAVRGGRVHMTGLRLLAPHLNAENHAEVLAEAAGKPTRQIEELVARLAPKPDVPTVIRKVTSQACPAVEASLALSLGDGVGTATRDSSPVRAVAPPAPVFARNEYRALVVPLSEETVKFQFTATWACRDKLRQAQDLLRHRIPDGDVGKVVEKALEVLIEQVKKERFAEGRTPRKELPEQSTASCSRHIPDAIKRAVFKRDGGRCTFTDEHGRRCAETGGLEFDHRDGFARTRRHQADRIRLLCRAHNQHAADEMYGRTFMQRARARGDPEPSLPGVPSD